MAIVLAIDPGTAQSGYCIFAHGKVYESGIEANEDMLCRVKASTADGLAIEMIASYGMPVGKEVFETCVWIGRYMQAWPDPEFVRLVYRRDVKMYLCGSARAKDGNIRQALLDKLGVVGTKKEPGPLYGVKSHAWAAVAVAVTATADGWTLPKHPLSTLTETI